ncbi:hypothetical protein KBC31_00115 [Candidatus Saccharibacteria bacterium]|jgi:hypothetical protein|nr:hypothetical protein [Candidatus Saccharibacteria bacterium]
MSVLDFVGKEPSGGVYVGLVFHEQDERITRPSTRGYRLPGQIDRSVHYDREAFRWGRPGDEPAGRAIGIVVAGTKAAMRKTMIEMGPHLPNLYTGEDTELDERVRAAKDALTPDSEGHSVGVEHEYLGTMPRAVLFGGVLRLAALDPVAAQSRLEELTLGLYGTMSNLGGQEPGSTVTSSVRYEEQL